MVATGQPGPGAEIIGVARERVAGLAQQPRVSEVVEDRQSGREDRFESVRPKGGLRGPSGNLCVYTNGGVGENGCCRHLLFLQVIVQALRDLIAKPVADA